MVMFVTFKNAIVSVSKGVGALFALMLSCLIAVQILPLKMGMNKILWMVIAAAISLIGGWVIIIILTIIKDKLKGKQ